MEYKKVGYCGPKRDWSKYDLHISCSFLWFLYLYCLRIWRNGCFGAIGFHYATYCNVDHAHKVNICEGGCEHINESFIINKHTGKNNTFSFYCKGKEIMLFQQIERNYNSEKMKKNSIKLF